MRVYVVLRVYDIDLVEITMCLETYKCLFVFATANKLSLIFFLSWGLLLFGCVVRLIIADMCR